MESENKKRVFATTEAELIPIGFRAKGHRSLVICLLPNAPLGALFRPFHSRRVLRIGCQFLLSRFKGLATQMRSKQGQAQLGLRAVSTMKPFQPELEER